MSGIINSIANYVRDANLSPEGRKAREEGKRALELVKLISIVSVVATAFFFAIFPCIFTFCLTGLAAFGASEVHKVANNILEILDTATVEFTARANKESLIAQVCKNTFVMQSVVRILNPDIKPPVVRV